MLTDIKVLVVRKLLQSQNKYSSVHYESISMTKASWYLDNFSSQYSRSETYSAFIENAQHSVTLDRLNRF